MRSLHCSHQTRYNALPDHNEMDTTMKKHLLMILVTLFLSGPLYAVATPNDTPDKVHVEIVVFRYVNAQTPLEEWQHPNLINIADAIELVLPEFSLEDSPTNYVLLPKDQMQLNAQEQALQNNDDYQVLLHLAWEQVISDSWHSKPVHVYGGENYTYDGELANELDGTIAISQGKFIQFKSDLNFTEPVDRIPFADADGQASTRSLPNLMTYHLVQSRRMKLDELNYLDHPNFGMLVRISPIKTLS